MSELFLIIPPNFSIFLIANASFLPYAILIAVLIV
jgi:hypothetical protein